MKILNLDYLYIIIAFLLLFLWVVINKDINYFKFIKKYWFYKKSKTKKMATSLYLIAVVIFFVSLLDFRLGEQEKKLNRSNNTIILIDNSLSMRTSDLYPSRMTKALQFANLFLEKEKGISYSLIVFSDFSKVLVPFTLDKEIIRSNLFNLNDVNIFRGGSNLFTSINQSISYLKKNSIKKIPEGNILVLTDGDVHDYTKRFSIPNGIKIASINFSSTLGGSVPSFDLDGNYKEPLLFKGKRVHSILDWKIFNKLENDFINFKFWNWKPGASLEKNISKFFRYQIKDRKKEKDGKVIFLTIWICVLGIVFFSLSSLASRLSSFNKNLSYIALILFTSSYNMEIKASIDLEEFLYSKVKNGKSSRVERLKLAEIYLKKDNYSMSKYLYEENLFKDYNKEKFGNLFNYGTLLLEKGNLKEGIKVFNKIKKIYKTKKNFNELEKKINTNVLIVLLKTKKKSTIEKLIDNNQKDKIVNRRKKIVNEISNTKKNNTILQDQLVNHVLSQDRTIRKRKMLLKIYKNKTNWEYKGW